VGYLLGLLLGLKDEGLRDGVLVGFNDG